METNRELEGRVALITGGAAGIGEGAARLFAQNGARLILADVNVAAGEALARELSAQTKAIFIPTDIRDSAAVRRLIQQARQEFERLDIVVNSAGIEGKHQL